MIVFLESIDRSPSMKVSYPNLDSANALRG